MEQSPIKIKGSNFTIAVLHIYVLDIKAIKKAIQDKINQSPEFFKNAPIVFNINGLSTFSVILSCYKAIIETGLKIVGISGCTNKRLRNFISNAGIPLLSEGECKNNKTNISSASDVAYEYEYGRTRMISNHVRSGQRIYAANCDLIVNANVSAGAELIADGNIHIYGRMSGRVLAGASGNRYSQIYCTHLRAELVSIANKFWLNEQIPVDFIGKTARFYLVDNALMIKNII